MKLVFLESENLGDDIDLERFRDFGEVVIYEQTPLDRIKARIADADVIILNKLPMNEQYLCDARNLKLICITATGTNNVDFEYTDRAGIRVKNVSGYSTEAVVGHTFALAFYLLEHLNYYDEYVKSGAYCKSPSFTYFGKKFETLSELKWGIVGLGAIGRKVAQVAGVFGAKVVYYSTSGKNHSTDFEEVNFETLLRECDIISVHAPLTPQTENLFGEAEFRKMKKTAYFINVGRGPIVNEEALKNALLQGEIAGAGLDVLSKEPMQEDNPLFEIKDSDKLIITPHIAWAATSARKRLMDMVYENVKEYVRLPETTEP